MIKTFKAVFSRRQQPPPVKRPIRTPTRLEQQLVHWLSEYDQRLTPAERKAACVLLCLLIGLFFGHVLLNNLSGARPPGNDPEAGVIMAPDITLPGDSTGVREAWKQLRQLTDSIHH